MKVAVLSDIHANWHALDAVLQHAGEVDEIICLGDVVGYGGEPERCVDHVMTEGWQTLVGNHDRACTDPQILDWFNEDAASVIRWTIDQLGPKRLDWLRGLPETGTRDGARLVHASPRDPIYEYILDSQTAAANLALLDGDPCFHGHSHLPGVFYVDQGSVSHSYWQGKIRLQGPILCNPGSVGQPRDGDPDASYGIWHVDEEMFEFRRVRYDRKKAQQSIRRAGLPERFAVRLDVGK